MGDMSWGGAMQSQAEEIVALTTALKQVEESLCTAGPRDSTEDLQFIIDRTIDIVRTATGNK